MLDIFTQQALAMFYDHLAYLDAHVTINGQNTGLLDKARYAVFKYLLYLSSNDGRVTEDESTFISYVTNYGYSRVRMNRAMKESILSDAGFPKKIPEIFIVLTLLDNEGILKIKSSKRGGGNRYEGHPAWAFLDILDQIGNRFCAFEAESRDTEWKISARKSYLCNIADCLDGMLKHKRYDSRIKYAPCVPAHPFDGTVEEIDRLYAAMEMDNPFMLSQYKSRNPRTRETNMREVKELENLLDLILCGTPDKNDLLRFCFLLRKGVHPGRGWKMPSKRQHKEHRMYSETGYEIDLAAEQDEAGCAGPLADFWKEREEADNLFAKQLLQFLDGNHENGGKPDAEHDQAADRSVQTIFGMPGMPAETAEPEQAQSAELRGLTLPKLYQKLDSLVGLTKVKADLSSTINYMALSQKREKAGMKSMFTTKHMVFTGNPGTGKTTVARLLAAIYKEMGILSKGQFIETDASGLIAEYVGQTAMKTRKIVQSAVGGVLFIDEAYMLNGKGNGNTFGEEAVAELIKLMEDYRDDLIVIFAGYTDLMNEFLNTNPGLRSRINKYIDFPNYSGSELSEIFQLMCRENDYLPDEGCLSYTEEYFKNRSRAGIKDYANARDVRNYLEQAIANQADRLSRTGKRRLTKCEMQTLTLEDVQSIDQTAGDRKETHHPIGFAL